MVLVLKSYTLPTLYKKGAVIFFLLWSSPNQTNPIQNLTTLTPPPGYPPLHRKGLLVLLGITNVRGRFGHSCRASQVVSRGGISFEVLGHFFCGPDSKVEFLEYIILLIFVCFRIWQGLVFDYRERIAVHRTA